MAGKKKINPNAFAYDSFPSAAGSNRPTWAEIDLSALVENYATLKSLLRTAGPDGTAPSGRPRLPRLLPVVKADAYGHGAVVVARVLASQGASAFAVALVEEAIELRQGGISREIIVLQGAWPGQEADIVEHRLTAVVHSLEVLQRLERTCREMEQIIPVHIEIDTGMARLGAAWDKMGPFVEALAESRHLRLQGTFSHLAGSEEEDASYSLEQIRRFEQAVEFMKRSGLDPGELHFANSAGLMYYHRLRDLSARPGISLYGYAPAPHRAPVALKRILSLKTRICHLQTLEPGMTVGYNRRFKAERTTRAATLPIGYADGYRHSLTGRGRVIIRDRYAAVLGAVAMDLIVVDVTDIPEAGMGDEVVLLGSSTHCKVDAQDTAGLIGCIPYEILCAISPRVPRIYTGDPVPAGGPATDSGANSTC